MKTSDVPKNLVALYAQVMLNYRQPEGDAAWGEIEKLIGVENTQTFSFLMGWVIGRQGFPSQADWEELQQLTTVIENKEPRLGQRKIIIE